MRSRRSISMVLMACLLPMAGGIGFGCGKVVPPPEEPPPSAEADAEDGGPLLPLAGDFEEPAPGGTSTAAPAPPTPSPSTGSTTLTEIGGLPIPESGILGAGEADKVIAPGEPPRIELLDAGAEPREALRFAPAAGKDGLGMTLRMSMKLKSVPQMPSEQPPVQIGFALDVQPATAEGDVPVVATVDTVGVLSEKPEHEQIAQVIRGALGAMKGLKVKYTLSPRGMHKKVDIELDQALPPAQQQIAAALAMSFRATGTPLPEEPVGVGARWQVLSRHADAGADLMQVTTYELKRREGNKLTVDIATRQVAASEDVAAPGLPPNLQTRLSSFVSGGDGKSEVDLGKAILRTGDSRVQTVMAIEVQQPGGAKSTEIDQVVAIEFYRPQS